MADESVAAAAFAQRQISELTLAKEQAKDFAVPGIADRAEQAVQLISRWAGIAAMVAAVAAIAWLLF